MLGGKSLLVLWALCTLALAGSKVGPRQLWGVTFGCLEQIHKSQINFEYLQGIFQESQESSSSAEAPEEDSSSEKKSEDSSEVKGKDSSEVMSIAGGPVDMSKLPPIPQEMPNHETLSDEVKSNV